MARPVFFISDGTGITAQTLGNSLITQFSGVAFRTTTLPYVDNPEKAKAVLEKINEYEAKGERPIVITTLVDPTVRGIIQQSKGLVLDLFNTFVERLEQELGVKSSHAIGRSHSMVNTDAYQHRISAVNYALEHDDGVRVEGYGAADVILIGVSRCGKTPTCLYLALQFGILAANYPFADDDLSHLTLPKVLQQHKTKLFGLSIDAERLQSIRFERLPNTDYSCMDTCRREVNEVEAMYRRENIACLNTSDLSIEEIATKILVSSGIERRIY